MTDNEIIELYFSRSENAISETDRKYGSLCRSVAFGILDSREDGEECVNDTYLKLWNVIPPKRPLKLCAFTVRIVRNLALNMIERASAFKRGGRYSAVAYDEISESLPDPGTVEKHVDDIELTETLERFIRSLDTEKQLIFLKRYWFFYSVSDIAEQMHISESKVKTTLMRTREKLKKYLEKEGIVL